MYNNFGSIGIQPIHIRFVSNASPQTVQTLTQKMLYTPDNNDNMESDRNNDVELNKYPFFTDTIKYSETDLYNLSRRELINTFFNSNTFRKNIMYHKQTATTESELASNADHNLNVMIRLLLCTSFPIANNVTDTYSQTISKKPATPVVNSSFTSYLTDLLKNRGNKFCYLNLNGSNYTLLSVKHVNELINDKLFKDFIRLVTSYKQWYDQIKQEYQDKQTTIENEINVLVKNHKENIIKSILEKNEIITKMLVTETDKRRNILVSAQPLVELLFKMNSDNFLEVMTDISELKKYAERKGSGVGYIPSKILDLDGFNEILTVSFERGVNKQILYILNNPKTIFDMFDKDIKINESNLVLITANDNIKKMKELSSFINYMNQFSKPHYTFSNSHLNTLISSYKTDYTKLFNIIDLINKLNTYAKPDKQLLKNEDIKYLRTGVISHIKTADKKKSDTYTEIFGLNSEKYYGVFLNLELIKGLLNRSNLEEIKCSYKNNNLINRYDNLKNKLDNINPVLLYIPNNLLDIDMLKSKSKKNNRIKTQKYTKKVRGGWRYKSLSVKNRSSPSPSPSSIKSPKGKIKHSKK